MRISRRRLVIILPATVGAVFAWWAIDRLGCVDRLGTSYATAADAIASGDMERGWLPSNLPPIATEIHEEHDLDTNEVWMRFTVSRESALEFVVGLQRLPPQDVERFNVRSPCDRSWWFDGLIEQQPANDGVLNADIYVGASPDSSRTLFVALDRTSSDVYYWSYDFRAHGYSTSQRGEP
jgi:hypothetical protein